MSQVGRLQDQMHEALIVAPGGYREDIPGPLHDVPWEIARAAVDAAVEVALLFIQEEGGRWGNEG